MKWKKVYLFLALAAALGLLLFGCTKEESPKPGNITVEEPKEDSEETLEGDEEEESPSLEEKDKEERSSSKNSDFLVIRENPFVDYSNKENAYALFDEIREEDPSVREERLSLFRTDYLNFSQDLFLGILQETKEDNLIFSPISAYIPMTEVSYTANKNSEAEAAWQKLLRPGSKDEKWTKEILPMFNTNAFTIGNSIWLSHRASPDIPFLKNNLESDIYRVSFSSKTVEKKQEDWANKWTKGFLSEDLKDFFKDSSGGGDELAVRLLGTAHFKSEWEEDFFEEKKDFFTNKDGEKEEIPFICSSMIREGADYMEKDFFTALRIPMKFGYFTVILPKEELTVFEVVQKGALKEVGNPELWEDVFATVDMPKFKEDSAIEILPILNKLGYSFGEYTPSYDALVGEGVDCKVGAITQQAKVDVNEKGVEAAAVTKMDMMMKSALFEEPKEIYMKVDRPYIYLIETNDHLPGFIGINQDL